MIFPEALESVEEFARFAQAVRAPLLANMTEFGRSPLIPFDELAALGFKAVIYPLTPFRAAMRAAEHVLKTLRDQGTQQGLLDQMQSRAELYELLGYNDWEAQRPGLLHGAFRARKTLILNRFSEMPEPQRPAVTLLPVVSSKRASVRNNSDGNRQGSSRPEAAAHAVQRGHDRRPDRRTAPGAVRRQPGRGCRAGLRGPGREARPDGFARLPGSAGRSERPG